MRHQRGLSRHRRGRGQIVLVPHGFEPDLRQRNPAAGRRHRDDRPGTRQPPNPRRTPLVVIMTPHTTRPLILTHSDAANSIPSAAQQSTSSISSAPTVGTHTHAAIRVASCPPWSPAAPTWLAPRNVLPLAPRNVLPLAPRNVLPRPWAFVRHMNDYCAVFGYRGLAAAMRSHVEPSRSDRLIAAGALRIGGHMFLAFLASLSRPSFSAPSTRRRAAF